MYNSLKSTIGKKNTYQAHFLHISSLHSHSTNFTHHQNKTKSPTFHTIHTSKQPHTMPQTKKTTTISSSSGKKATNKHTTAIRAIKRQTATAATSRKLAIPFHRLSGNDRFKKYSMKGRRRCARLNVTLANTKGRGFVSGPEMGEREEVEREGGY